MDRPTSSLTPIRYAYIILNFNHTSYSRLWVLQPSQVLNYPPLPPFFFFPACSPPPPPSLVAWLPPTFASAPNASTPPTWPRSKTSSASTSPLSSRSSALLWVCYRLRPDTSFISLLYLCYSTLKPHPPFVGTWLIVPSKVTLVAEGLKEGGTVVMNTPWTVEEMDKHFPADLKRDLAKKNVKLYNIDASKVLLTHSCQKGSVLSNFVFFLINIESSV